MSLAGGMSALWRRARIVLRFLFPGAGARRQAARIRQSGEFDRAFYLSSNPRLRRLFRRDPELHYVLFGEAVGLCPNPGFAPRAYRYNNPEVAHHPALLHYIESGRAEARRVFNTEPPDLSDALPAIGPADRPDPPAPVAVVLHLYYHDMWPEFAAALERQVFAFDLFVTATGTPDEVAPVKDAILARWPAARVWAMPNHGRDIFPFLHLVTGGLLDPYRAVCKLHTKRSPHRADGEAWRQGLTGAVLGPPEETARRLERFLDDSRAGIWTASGQIHEGGAEWGMNRDRALALLDRAGQGLPDRPLRFPAGSIYWLKPAVIAALKTLRLGPGDFEPEQFMVDGTTAHAVERLIGPLAMAEGLEIRTEAELDGT